MNCPLFSLQVTSQVWENYLCMTLYFRRRREIKCYVDFKEDFFFSSPSFYYPLNERECIKQCAIKSRLIANWCRKICHCISIFFRFLSGSISKRYYPVLNARTPLIRCHKLCVSVFPLVINTICGMSLWIIASIMRLRQRHTHKNLVTICTSGCQKKSWSLNLLIKIKCKSCWRASQKTY